MLPTRRVFTEDELRQVQDAVQQALVSLANEATRPFGSNIRPLVTSDWLAGWGEWIPVDPRSGTIVFIQLPVTDAEHIGQIVTVSNESDDGTDFLVIVGDPNQTIKGGADYTIEEPWEVRTFICVSPTSWQVVGSDN